MTGREIGFICVLILNLIIAIIYLVWNVIYHKSRSYLTGFIVMVTCPVIGVLFYGGAYFIYKVFFRAPVDLEDVVFSKERVKAVVGSEEEQERNMVSLEEAIEITDEHALRTLMMNIAKCDIQKLLRAISLALDSEDTETAHYAASVLQDALNEFRVHVERQQMLIFSDDSDRLIYAETLLMYMNEVLKQRVFTDIEQKNYVHTMDRVCEKIFEEAPERVTSEHYEAVSMRLLEIKEYDLSEKWCLRAKEYCPNVLSTYSCMLKLYFTNENREKFFEVFRELKQSPVVVDSETLQMLRVFSE